MPLLLYCVAPESAIETTVKGVGGAPVRRLKHGELNFFYSDISGDGPDSSDIAKAAEQVHAVVSDIFTRSAVLPFRYPTVVAGDNELARLAEERGAAFREYLERVAGKVQMDVRLTGSSIRGQRSAGGRAYLEGRAKCQAQLSDAAERCRQAVDSAEWRIQQRGENIRCQALISQVEVISFFERMRALKLPDGVKAAVSGPWPPAGFWDDEPR